ncbi:MAG: DUF4342 domain-containing protein [Clostridiales bacterium]|nr:DUF4342 domain-containing protein [Clostridiales bacterium]
MNIKLEDIDIIRERTNLSYKEAKEVLEKANGDIVEALIAIEEESDVKWTENINDTASEILRKLKKIIEKGNVTKIILKKDDEIILNIPVTAGAIGVILAPIVALLGISAALVTKAKIEIIQDDGKVVDLNEVTVEKVEQFKSKFTKDDVKDNDIDMGEDQIYDDF